MQTDDALDLTKPRRLHVVGVGGPGMNPIAAVLAAQGHDVSGSDMKDSAGLTRLRSLGVDVTVGHDPRLVDGVDAVIHSTAVPDHNIELVAARDAGTPVLRRIETLGGISRLQHTVSVAGTHGKTTTTSMLAVALIEAGMHPSFIVGGDVNDIGSGAVWDEDGRWFVVEADESDGTFLGIDSEIAVVTNIDRDHLEYHGTFEDLVDAFRRFMAAAGRRIVCADNTFAAELGSELGAVSYGLAESADYRIVDVSFDQTISTFTIEHEGERFGPVSLPIPGLHNVSNAVAAWVTAITMGADPDDAIRGLERFGGVARRFEFRGDAAGITFVDDYAHLGNEVGAAIAAARGGGWRRVVAVFQPHRYSRTAAVWPEFADAFTDADLTVITDVYSAGEAVRPGVTGMLITNAVLDAHPHARVAYLPTREQLQRYLLAELRPGDICLTLGAGDLTSLPDQLIRGVCD
ncbi:MAG: UDP-N-acetylmuramate--L-alanine ligase [Actinomycetia bacterium]|nr:UDP-N-acetylmuramate--L-alanine ligase [Actinomycetes bacterium]MCP4962626.1 UDP-N-acetylmuramate--L-alanine ligase [Actinomycetes bacterium]